MAHPLAGTEAWAKRAAIHELMGDLYWIEARAKELGLSAIVGELLEVWRHMDQAAAAVLAAAESRVA
jgi:hypothetical protein